jgi:hypothetical protein
MSTTSLAIAAVLPGRPRVLADALPPRRALDATLVLAGLATPVAWRTGGRLDGGVER